MNGQPKARVAVVTGANRGIGFEICRQLSRLGIRVIVTSRDSVKGMVAREKLSAEGLKVDFLPLNVTDPESIQRMASDVRRSYERLDVLVNNAGVYIDDRHSLLTVKLDVMRRTMNTNAFGPLMLCQALVPIMKEHGYGRIVNISSGYGQLSSLSSSYPAYSLSKAVLNVHTRILAAELQGSGIKVNAVCPGWVRTDIGGRSAPVTPAEGADTAVWLATLPDDGPTGGFFRDRKPIPW